MESSRKDSFSTYSTSFNAPDEAPHSIKSIFDVSVAGKKAIKLQTKKWAGFKLSISRKKDRQCKNTPIKNFEDIIKVCHDFKNKGPKIDFTEQVILAFDTYKKLLPVQDLINIIKKQFAEKSDEIGGCANSKKEFNNIYLKIISKIVTAANKHYKKVTKKIIQNYINNINKNAYITLLVLLVEIKNELKHALSLSKEIGVNMGYIHGLQTDIENIEIKENILTHIIFPGAFVDPSN